MPLTWNSQNTTVVILVLLAGLGKFSKYRVNVTISVCKSFAGGECGLKSSSLPMNGFEVCSSP